MERPNILWYCTDQQRYDTVHCLGNEHIRTPVLDRLASHGTAFTRCYTQSPICTPSRATFLTGRYPATHHVHRNGADVFPSSEVLVTRLLADAGYDCGLAGKLHLSRAKGRVEKRPDDGYRAYYWSHHPRPDWPEGHDYADWLRNEKGVDPEELFGEQRSLFYGAGVPAELHQTTWCTERAIRFIEERRDGPWLMSINPFDPHPPFDPPKDYLDRYDPSTLPLPLFAESDIDHQRKFRGVDQQTMEAVNPLVARSGDAAPRGRTDKDTASTPPTEYDARRVRACYYAMIELIDEQLGRIVETLERSGQRDNTIIVFTSDHGELLGDHGLLYKGCRFYDSLVRVPLIISWPAAYRRGLVSDALVELVDLAPTLLRAAGLDVPPYMQGRSLGSILEGSADPDVHKGHVVCEYSDAVDLPRASHASMYFDGRHKSVVYHDAGVGELYNLEEDTGEFRDLWDDPSYRGRRCEVLGRHFDAMMATSSAGIGRTGSY